jgi:hypothetical protein
MSDPAPKAYRAKQAGVKFNKKKAQLLKKQLSGNVASEKEKRRNFKAFGFNSTIRARVGARFAAEREQKRQHFVLPVRDTATPPPLLVAVVGPPGVGKSTVIKSLVKNYARVNVHDTTGPITIATGKTRRVTLLEVPNDMGSMLDAAKTADLVLLVIDGAFGFEMETFEFLNILKTHGFPKVIGVLTHLDSFRDSKPLRRLKKVMKDRFWSEVCKGAKLFYFSGVLHGKYLRREVINLGRFISVTKPTPLQWRVAHSYLLADRVEDMTHPGLIEANPVADRTVALYGYVRGTSLKPGQNIHVAGVGDFAVDSLTILDDPLPLAKSADTDVGTDGRSYRRSLKEKERQVYAPMADIGDVVYDKDAVYITIKDTKVTYTPAHMLLADARSGAAAEAHTAEAGGVALPTDVAKRLAERVDRPAGADRAGIDALGGEALVRSLQTQGAGGGIDVAMQSQHAISLFKGGKSITASQFDRISQIRKGGYADDALPAAATAGGKGADGSDDDEDEAGAGSGGEDVYDRMQVKEIVGPDGRVRRQVVFADGGDAGGSDDDDDGDNDDDEAADSDADAGDDDDYYKDDEEEEMGPRSARRSRNPDNDNEEEGDVDSADDYSGGDEGDFEGDDDEEEDEEDEDTPEGPVDSYDFLASDFGAQKPTAGAAVGSKNGGKKAAAASGDDDGLGGDLGVHAADWKEMLAARAKAMARSVTLSELVYGADSAVAAGAAVARGARAEGADRAQLRKNQEAADPALKGTGGSGSGSESADDGDAAAAGDDDDEDDFFKPRVAVTGASSLKLGSRAGALVNNPKRTHNEAGSTNIHGAGAGGAGVSAADTTVAGDGIDSVMRLRREADMQGWGAEAVDKAAVMRNRFVTGDWSVAVGVDPAAAAAAAAEGQGQSQGIFGGDEDDDVAMEGLWGARDSDRVSAKTKAGLAFAGGAGGSSDAFLDENDSLGTGLGGDDDVDGDAARRRVEAKTKLKHKFLGELEQAVAGELNDDDDDGDGPKQAGQRDARDAKKFDHQKEAGYDFFAAQKLQAAQRAAANKAEFVGMSEHDRLIMEGAQPGRYVRLLLSRVPCEFVQYFDRRCPVLVGALLANEQNLGFVQARLKRHRWHKRILKTNDPLVFSMGWRRFQSLPLFSIEDQNGRFRYLKYTPEHMHCLCTFYGPLTTPNSGLMAFKAAFSARDDGRAQASFRVSGTGTVLEMSKAPSVMKKLKLVGTPLKIMKNTAYIQDMFTSAVEAARFEGAKIRTVSGVRGQIKKAVLHEGKEGTVRATFEDKILTSDLIFCRTWTDVSPYEYYNPVSSMLAPDKRRWRGMRSVRDIRADMKLPVPSLPDSEYKPVIREARKFNALRVPLTLQRALPFTNKPKTQSRKRTATLEDRRAEIYDKEESSINRIMTQVRAVAGQQERMRRENNKVRVEKLKKKISEQEDRKSNNERLKHVTKIKNRMAQQGQKYTEKRYSTGRR